MATKIEQQGRPLQARTPLSDPDELIPLRLVGSEGLSRPFRFVVDFLSPTAGLAVDKLLDKGIGLMAFGAPNTTRLVHGRVSNWAELGLSGTSGLTHYRAELVPTFSLLALSADCRTFENHTVREIVETIFGVHQFTDFRFSLKGATPTVPYVAQYQESDFAFVSRLLEEHGLHYTFEHQLDKHVLVITDRLASLVPVGVLTPVPVTPFLRKSAPNIPGIGPSGKAAGDATGAVAGTIVGLLLGPLGPVPGAVAGGLVGGALSSLVADLIDSLFGSGDTPPENAVIELLRERRMHTKKMSARDSHLLRAADEGSAPSAGAGVRGEQFEFLGDLSGTPAAGVAKATATQRIEVAEAGREVFRGSSTACPLIPGTRVVVKGGILGTAGSELHVTEVAHVMDAGDILTGDKSDAKYINEFVAIPVDVQYRPEHKTPRPSVRGTQTAEVTGKGGPGQIDVDENGSVLLKFPWDRGDGAQGKSQHRVHVASVWAGQAWGFVQIPRIGQIVLVEYFEGDLDRPIVTGRVYDENDVPPYTLPDNKTQSGWKSRTLGGTASNFNEIRFEDKQGAEHVFMQAEKDLLVRVKSDEVKTVGHDRAVTVQHFDHLEVKDGEHKITVTKGNERIECLEGNQEVLVKTGDQTLAVHEGTQALVTFDGKQIMKANGDQFITCEVGDQKIHVIDGSSTFTVDTGPFTLRALNDDLTVHADVGDIVVKADAGKITIEAAMELELKVGPCSLKITPQGIELKGPNIKLQGDAQVEVKGAVVKVNGDAMLQLKAPMSQLNADGLLMAKGGVTMIN